MAFKASDPIMGKTRGSIAICYAHATRIGADRLNEVSKYITEIYRLGPLVGIDAYVLYTQAVHETGDFQSSWWNDRLNPAGIGITGDKKQDAASRTWDSGTEAAKSHVAHMLMYTLGKIDRGGLTKANDPRYSAYLEAHGSDGIAETVEDLENTWGIDNGYAEAMERRGNEIWSAVPNAQAADTPTEEEDDNVPSTYTPNIIDKWLHVAQGGYNAVERRYIGRRGMTPKIIVVHIQEGYNLGSWQWFHETTASATVEIAHNGDIWRLVPESDAPWTNGDVNNPSTIGREVINKWGADPNVYTLSIENEGFSTETHTSAAWAKNKAAYAKQVQSNLWQIQKWMTTYRIDAVYVIRHKDISQNGKPTCPGDAFYNDLMTQLKAGGIPVEPSQPVYATPSKVEGFDGTKDVVVNGITFHADKKTVLINNTEQFFRQYAGSTSSSTKAPQKQDTTFKVLGWVEGEKVQDESRWWIADDYSRTWVGGTREKPTTTPPVPTEPDQPSDPEVINKFGILHYPAFEPNSVDPRKFTVSIQGGGVVRALPATTAKKVRNVEKGDELVAKYWCWGEAVKGDRIWWLLDNGTDDPFTNPQYIWSATSSERPD